MTTTTPTLSIVVPVYNRAEHLSACVESTIRQTFTDIEVLLVDDYSNQETHNFLHLFAVKDARIRVLTNTGAKGANACRNLGLRESRGEFVIFLDSDDILSPFCVELRIKDMQAAPTLDFIAYPCLMFQNRPLDRLIIWNVPTPHALLDRFLRHDAPFQTSGPIWRRARITGVIGWDENLHGWQDWKFHVEALLAGLNGYLHTRIDYFWNAPKANSITRLSHNAAGRIQRMQILAKLADTVPEPRRAEILSSVVTLALRMARENRLQAALAAYSTLKGRPKAAHALAFVLLEPLLFFPAVYLRGFFRKQLYAAYPLIGAIMKESNTYKLVASQEQLAQLIELLRFHSKRRRQRQKKIPYNLSYTAAINARPIAHFA